CRIDARVGVILAKNRYSWCAGEGCTGRRRWRNGDRTGKGRRIAARRIEACHSDNFLLLNAIRGDGANLRQHVLPRVEDSSAGAKHGLIFAANVPGEADARLEHLVVVRDFPGRWKSWIAQI